MNEQHIEELNRKVEELQEFRDDVIKLIDTLWRLEMRRSGATIRSPLYQFRSKYSEDYDVKV